MVKSALNKLKIWIRNLRAASANAALVVNLQSASVQQQYAHNKVVADLQARHNSEFELLKASYYLDLIRFGRCLGHPREVGRCERPVRYKATFKNGQVVLVCGFCLRDIKSDLSGVVDLEVPKPQSFRKQAYTSTGPEEVRP